MVSHEGDAKKSKRIFPTPGVGSGAWAGGCESGDGLGWPPGAWAGVGWSRWAGGRKGWSVWAWSSSWGGGGLHRSSSGGERRACLAICTPSLRATLLALTYSTAVRSAGVMGVRVMLGCQWGTQDQWRYRRCSALLCVAEWADINRGLPCSMGRLQFWQWQGLALAGAHCTAQARVRVPMLRLGRPNPSSGGMGLLGPGLDASPMRVAFK